MSHRKGAKMLNIPQVIIILITFITDFPDNQKTKYIVQLWFNNYKKELIISAYLGFNFWLSLDE